MGNGELGIGDFPDRYSLRKPILSLFVIIPCSFLLLGASQNPQSPAPITNSELNEQLNIPLNNGTQGELRDEADRLVRLGGQSKRQGNLDKAIPYWWQAIKIYHQIGDIEAVGRVYDFVGLAYAELGDYQRAEDYLRRRLGYARENKDTVGQIIGLNNIGTILLKRGSYPAARTTFEDALTIARSIENTEGIGLSLNNLGLAAYGVNEYNQAIVFYEEALIYRNRSGDAIGQANTLNNLGDAYRAKDPQAPYGSRNFRDTIGVYGAALAVSRSSLDLPNQYRAIDALVQIYCDVKLFTRAYDLLDRRLAISQSEENPRQELKTLQTLAGVYQAEGRYEDARNAYQRAIAVARVLKDTHAESILLGQVIDLPKEPGF